jgi:hypothetical protein
MMGQPKIKTSHVNPPIPIRQYDWCAYDDNTYDGAEDAGPQIMGHGATEAEAIAQFQERWAEAFPHVLNIASLHDGMASCSCGGWTFAATGKTTREHIESEWEMHVKFRDYIEGIKR